ncbi:restriction endonuclease [Proteus mirabilis]|uniref:restriction endonuclease n=1 Tax=Proteus mirabilis TaxID=584 RepID=UPI003CF864DD
MTIMYNSGKEYEELVRNIQYSLIVAENIPSLSNINIEKNKKIKDRSGIEREFDIYWEFEIGGNLYRSVIECKDYSTPISIEKIDAFIGKSSDIPGLKLIYATRTGYQSGAKIKAEQHNIQLLIIREQQDSDWITEDGEPLLKTIHLNIVANLLPTITNFTVRVDSEWFKSQKDYTEYDVSILFQNKLNNELFINNTCDDSKYTIHDIPQRILIKNENLEYGTGTFSETFKDGWLEDANGKARLKILEYSCTYTYRKPIESTSIIDLSQQIKAIVDDFQSGRKKWVMNDGSIR